MGSGRKSRGQSSAHGRKHHHQHQQQEQQIDQVLKELNLGGRKDLSGKRNPEVLPSCRREVGLWLLILVGIPLLVFSAMSAMNMKIYIQYEMKLGSSVVLSAGMPADDDALYSTYPIYRDELSPRRFSSLSHALEQSRKTAATGAASTLTAASSPAAVASMSSRSAPTAAPVERLAHSRDGLNHIFTVVEVDKPKAPASTSQKNKSKAKKKKNNNSTNSPTSAPTDTATTSDSDTDPEHDHGDVFPRTPMVLPKLCDDGITEGFADWNTLREALLEANALGADRHYRWAAYFKAELPDGDPYTFLNPTLYYEDPVTLKVCPNTVLYTRGKAAFINTENLSVQCTGCSVVGSGTHLRFGPYARDVLIRGLSFKGATTSSTRFPHDGAEVVFQDCHWKNNHHVLYQQGGVAEVNSTR